MKAITACLCFLTLPMLAGEHYVLVRTNIAQALGESVVLRSFIEPQIYVTVQPVWVPGREVDGTNGIRYIHQDQVLMTNRTLRFTFEGKEYVQPIGVDAGPVVGSRVMELPLPLPTKPDVAIRLRK